MILHAKVFDFKKNWNQDMLNPAVKVIFCVQLHLLQHIASIYDFLFSTGNVFWSFRIPILQAKLSLLLLLSQTSQFMLLPLSTNKSQGHPKWLIQWEKNRSVKGQGLISGGYLPRWFRQREKLSVNMELPVERAFWKDERAPSLETFSRHSKAFMFTKAFEVVDRKVSFKERERERSGACYWTLGFNRKHF